MLQIQINGDLWDRKETCLIAKDGDGKQLKICNRKTDGSSHSGMHEEETEVISYDGKEWTEGSWDEIIPTLTAKGLPAGGYKTFSGIFTRAEHV